MRRFHGIHKMRIYYIYFAGWDGVLNALARRKEKPTDRGVHSVVKCFELENGRMCLFQRDVPTPAHEMYILFNIM